MSEVVGSELHFEAVNRQRARDGHDARVVDEEIEPRMCPQPASGKFADGAEISHVEALDVDLGPGMPSPDGGGDMLATSRVPHGEGDLGPMDRKFGGRD